ncbi:MAG: hypothetical protein Ct9H300mP19_15240 [Dehalococcoidia bacterium]|nr:MAG: hypothetical protein Ct9H300mP19_15240 [Dehalococcoidia bacterium]
MRGFFHPGLVSGPGLGYRGVYLYTANIFYFSYQLVPHSLMSPCSMCMPKPGPDEGKLSCHLLGFPVPGIRIVSSSGTPGSVPNQYSAIGDSVAAIAKFLPERFYWLRREEW